VANAPIVDVKLLDGAAVVHMLNPGTVKTFQEYVDTVFLPYEFIQLSREWMLFGMSTFCIA